MYARIIYDAERQVRLSFASLFWRISDIPFLYNHESTIRCRIKNFIAKTFCNEATFPLNSCLDLHNGVCYFIFETGSLHWNVWEENVHNSVKVICTSWTRPPYRYVRRNEWDSINHLCFFSKAKRKFERCITRIHYLIAKSKSKYLD